jgi:hypothetical protein
MSQAVQSDAADQSVPGGDSQAESLSPFASALVSEAQELQAQEPRVEHVQVPVQAETARPEQMSESEGIVESDIQIAALVDDGWQLRPRHYTSWGFANSIRGGGGGGGSRGSADGETPPNASDSGENAALPTDTIEEHETRQPSGEPAGSGDENSSATPGETSKYPPTKHGDTAPQDTAPQDTGPREEDLVEQYPIDNGGNGPIYIPPQETNPPVVRVPEPASLGLFGLALIGCAIAGRKRAT